jgi:hypothetical protein
MLFSVIQYHASYFCLGEQYTTNKAQKVPPLYGCW